MTAISRPMNDDNAQKLEDWSERRAASPTPRIGPVHSSLLKEV